MNRFVDRPRLSRRRFVQGVAAASAIASLGVARSVRAMSATAPDPSVLSGTEFHLSIGMQPVDFTGHRAFATAVNGQVPAPLLRWRQGDAVTLHVRNALDVPSSMHWHGIIVPADMDGVPGLSYRGIAPGGSYTYRFTVNQRGTYWYHSHSRFQEQTGTYGPIVIEPRDGERVAADREHVIVLSDWSDTSPEAIYATLKKQADYYNFGQPTAGEFLADVGKRGLDQALARRRMWQRMRMTTGDLADVSGYTYTYLMNGTAPAANWTGLFQPGERVRLRFINGSAMSFFDVRIPGLKMTVVAADGQDVEPVSVDEFRMGVAECYDVLVEPGDGAYTVFAQSMDRSGFARGTLAPRAGMQAEVPPMDPRPVLTMVDMMGDRPMAGMSSMHGMDHGKMSMPHAMPGGGHDNMAMAHDGHMQPIAMGDMPGGQAKPPVVAPSDPVKAGPGVAMRVRRPRTNLDDPGAGLRHNGRRVLSYADLHTLGGPVDAREPGREIRLYLTGNMDRYMWSFNGTPFVDAQPLRLKHGEQVRITLVNDTMMAHPIHLHGMWSELESPRHQFQLRKHTISVQPAQQVSYRVSADAVGRWAYHCHLLYHMEAGMFREVVVA
ncbi:copper resistance system multicopper oxidase [Oleiagrimonas sp. C23AA]|uniref:copper resistance system multicopper oxidase n=1 Tax=Oleiagrimonas sp. C23AA TaxID=2719047 RepID=UPI00141F4BEA|nr:copper resistance system multicopper oxidase [Oleiagrimonas sp. C23AA]NII09096.1 copper resistance system multicopper oxidase [Oleiagrimonas sp. C23AA]